jgi:hypothetical protein
MQVLTYRVRSTDVYIKHDELNINSYPTAVSPDFPQSILISALLFIPQKKSSAP